MTRTTITLLAIFSLAILPFAGNCQKIMRGVIVDSLSLDNLAGVSVQVKNSDRGTISDFNGIFSIAVHANDTLLFSHIGYKRSRLPVPSGDEIMFVRLQSESVLLNEVIIKDNPIKKINSRALSSIKPLKAGNGVAPANGGVGVGVNFGYFSKPEKEKRKLVSVLRELSEVKVYDSIVNDPSFKYEIMAKYSIDEARFFELLALFNQKFTDVIHSGNESLILYSVHKFFAGGK